MSPYVEERKSKGTCKEILEDATTIFGEASALRDAGETSYRGGKSAAFTGGCQRLRRNKREL